MSKADPWCCHVGLEGHEGACCDACLEARREETPYESERRPLIERLLDLRAQPLDFDSLGDVNRDGEAWIRQAKAIDTAMDLLIEALREVGRLTMPSSHTSSCISVKEVRKILGEATVEKQS